MSPVRPRIGFLCQRLLLGFGVDLVVDRQARWLQHRGYPVTVYAHRVGDQYRTAVYDTVSLSDRISQEVTFVDPAFQDAALPYLRSRPVDLWIIQTPPFHAWAPELGPPVIHYEHGTPDGHFFRGPRRLELDWETRCRYEHVYNQVPNTHAVVVISEFIRSRLPEPIRSHAITIPNGSDHYPEATEEEARRIRGDLGLNADEILLLYVSRIVFEGDDQPYKGVHDLLARWPALQRKNPNLRLVLAGRGDPADAPRITGRGVIPYLNVPVERMPALYRAADLYVCPSRWEGFNLPAAEAQFQGTPVLAYRIGAHPEVIDDPSAGRLVDTPRQWGRALAELTRDPEGLRGMADGARESAGRFTWHRNGVALEGLVQAVHGIAHGDPDGRALTERVGVGPGRNWGRTRLILRRVVKDEGVVGVVKLVGRRLWQRR